MCLKKIGSCPRKKTRMSNCDLDTKGCQAKEHHDNDDQVATQIEKIFPGEDCPAVCHQIWNQAGIHSHLNG